MYIWQCPLDTRTSVTSGYFAVCKTSDSMDVGLHLSVKPSLIDVLHVNYENSLCKYRNELWTKWSCHLDNGTRQHLYNNLGQKFWLVYVKWNFLCNKILFIVLEGEIQQGTNNLWLSASNNIFYFDQYFLFWVISILQEEHNGLILWSLIILNWSDLV